MCDRGGGSTPPAFPHSPAGAHLPRVYRLRAEDAKEMNVWVHMLRRAQQACEGEGGGQRGSARWCRVHAGERWLWWLAGGQSAVFGKRLAQWEYDLDAWNNPPSKWLCPLLSPLAVQSRVELSFVFFFEKPGAFFSNCKDDGGAPPPRLFGFLGSLPPGAVLLQSC